MTEDDLLTCLTRQVKEDVIENYLTERRLVELQIEELESTARNVWTLADETGRRFSRMGFLMIESTALTQLMKTLRIPPETFWGECMSKPFLGGVRFIQVIALTNRTKFRKLVMEAYRRLHKWVEKYREAYQNLEAECGALNKNIIAFRNKFDLLTILNFLKSLDVCELERKHFLGENFTAEELSSIDRKLYIHTRSIEPFNLPPPPELKFNFYTEEAVGNLAVDIYDRNTNKVKRFMR
jgi:hypothetical protein